MKSIRSIKIAIALSLLCQAYPTWAVDHYGGGPHTFLARIKARHNGKCLDLVGKSTSPGTQIHQWTCDTSCPPIYDTSPPEVWNCTFRNSQTLQFTDYWNPISPPDDFYTVAALGGLVLDVRNGVLAPGTPIQGWPRNRTVSQRLETADDGRIFVKGTNLCLAIQQGSVENGALVILETCTGAANQLFDTVELYRYQ